MLHNVDNVQCIVDIGSLVHSCLIVGSIRSFFFAKQCQSQFKPVFFFAQAKNNKIKGFYVSGNVGL